MQNSQTTTAQNLTDFQIKKLIELKDLVDNEIVQLGTESIIEANVFLLNQFFSGLESNSDNEDKPYQFQNFTPECVQNRVFEITHLIMTLAKMDSLINEFRMDKIFEMLKVKNENSI